MSIRIERDRIEATRAGQWAERVDADSWRVSWLDGDWNRNHAIAALNIAELVAIGPPLGHPYWMNVENFLTELGVDPAVLDNLIDPEPDDEGEDLS
ncbi:hypothetical protein [Stackebrandtia nassauensis]|uniref:Uncharacterized protein n=1 Tax=Stackebrandtia nassauensis (strain DSM 44728 / CIP 108903 / NRRL B-16338 / NBRC 102104 / LLR-40K-21) TaxID=446470 RepID=D3Q971_STANL|nr:hypothetical protein [Stackebrandtia nassauensis]ADD40680.1 hypothetical protein Snas_0970 [Stackebrandtia nassauensis DSM 44728]